MKFDEGRCGIGRNLDPISGYQRTAKLPSHYYVNRPGRNRSRAAERSEGASIEALAGV